MVNLLFIWTERNFQAELLAREHYKIKDVEFSLILLICSKSEMTCLRFKIS